MTNITDLAEVLMVEDNPADITLTQMILKHHGIMVNFTFVRDGEECVEFLKEHIADGRSGADLVLLDLNLPRMDGREVLQFIQKQDALKQLPIVVVSGSSAETDVESAFELGAILYLIKPINLDSLQHITEKIGTLQLTAHQGRRYLTRKTLDSDTDD